MKLIRWFFTSLLFFACTSPLLAQEPAAVEAAKSDAATAPATQEPAAPQATPDAPAATQPAADQATPHLILIIGAPGEDRFAGEFSRWADRLENAAAASGVTSTIIGKSAPAKVAATDAPATTDPAPANKTPNAAKSELQQTLDAIQQHGSIPTTEPLWVIFVGHGTFNRKSAALALRGPDLTDQQLADSCKSVTRPLAIVLCSSCSSPFVNALSGPGRVIVTATKDGNQIQYSRFGDTFSEAIAGLDADSNRDGQTSLLEAWLYASRRTAEFYKTEGRLATEHALLEDNGDAKGIKADVYVGDKPAQNLKADAPIDGSVAARLFLVRSEEERQLTPEQRVTRDALEAQLEDLKRRKGSMDEATYLQELDRVLMPLAELYRDVRKP